MSEQEYQEMMQDLKNDPDYIAFIDTSIQKTREDMERLTDEEISEIYEKIVKD